MKLQIKPSLKLCLNYMLIGPRVFYTLLMMYQICCLCGPIFGGVGDFAFLCEIFCFDPTSPFLFLLAMEELNHTIKIAQFNDWAGGFGSQSNCTERMELSHLYYALQPHPTHGPFSQFNFLSHLY